MLKVRDHQILIRFERVKTPPLYPATNGSLWGLLIGSDSMVTKRDSLARSLADSLIRRHSPASRILYKAVYFENVSIVGVFCI